MSNLIAQVLQSTWYGKKTKLSLANTGAPGAHASLGRASICRPSPTEASSRQKKKLLPQNWHLTCTRLRLIVDQALKTLRSAPKASKKKTFPGLSFKMSPVKKKTGFEFQDATCGPHHLQMQRFALLQGQLEHLQPMGVTTGSKRRQRSPLELAKCLRAEGIFSSFLFQMLLLHLHHNTTFQLSRDFTHT